MLLRKILVLAMVIASPLALAQDLKKDSYAEFGIGLETISDASTKPLTGTSSSGAVTYNNLRANLEFDNAMRWSLEYGRYIDRGLGLRAGVSYSSFKAKLKRVYGTGSYSYNGNTYNISNSYDRSELDNAASFDITAKILSANLYKDFDQAESDFTPYIGLGLGLADIQNVKDKEMAFSLIVGFNYDLFDSTYIGGKFLSNKISGPTSSEGLKYEDLDSQTWSLQIGRRF